MLDIEIDGKQTQVPAGSTIMDAAQQLGVYIPHFCYHKKLSIAANCRMCLVQVEKAPKPLPACATPVSNGMKVFTHSALAVEAQKGVMEFLLLNHPLDCPICDQGGECQLQDLAVGYGGGAAKYQEAKRVVMHKNVGPLISMQEMSRCIHCTRCVRFGQEVAGVMELGMANRNMHSEIQTFVGRAVESELSGNMIDLCPVGALTSKPFRYSARSWELANRRSIAPHDCVGSNITVQTKNNKVVRVLARENEQVNECWISDRDRFSYESLTSEKRLTKPMVRVDGKLKEVEWPVALDYVAHGLKDVVKTHGASELAVLLSPSCTVEEMYLASKVTKGMGSKNVDFRLRQSDFRVDAHRAGTPWLGLKLDEIAQLDAAFIVGGELRADAPLVAQRFRQLAKTKPVCMLSATAQTDLISLASHAVTPNSRFAEVLASVIKEVAHLVGKPTSALVAAYASIEATEIKEIAATLVNQTQVLIAISTAVTRLPNYSEILVLANDLAGLIGARVGQVTEGANQQGGYTVGACSSEANAYELMASTKKAFVFVGSDPEFDAYNPAQTLAAVKKSDLVVKITPFVTEASLDYADALLPMAAFTESSGTYVNCEGRIQSFSGVSQPLGESRPAWKILRVLGNLLQLEGFDYSTSDDVKNCALSQCADFVGGLDNSLSAIPKLESTSAYQGAGLERLGGVPIYLADAYSRNANALNQTVQSRDQSVQMNESTHRSLGLTGKRALVRQAEFAVQVEVSINEAIPDGCVYIPSAHKFAAGLGDMNGTVAVECMQ